MPVKLETSPVVVFTALPETENDAEELLAEELDRLNGFGAPPTAGGVQIWPAAGAAKHCAEENTPGAIIVRSKRMFGAAEKVRNEGRRNGVPGGWLATFRSRIVPV